ncbi:MAG: hypothetical protein QG553_194 [Patescibacteria group bacterium]|nr:hypothetical protein [Patescibacteria group bacterium]
MGVMSSASAVLEFASKYPVKKCLKGELILVEGEAPNCAYVIKRGIVKGYALTADGVEKPISFDTVGELFPIGWVFSKIKWSQYYYGAFSDCELYCVPRQDYIDFVQSNPQLNFQIYRDFIDSYLYFQMRVNALEQSKAIDKIIHTLHYLALRFGREIKADTVQITIPLTQQELANIMGLTRETTGLELNRLIKQGIIKQDRRKQFIVFTDRLNEALDIDYGLGRIDKTTKL